ncbi:hypothetical protein Bca101_022243 [Brassica carinata]
MEASSFRKKFKEHLFVKHGKLSEATEYYVNAFGTVKIGSFDPPPCVELFLAGTTLVISEKVVEPYSGITLQVTVDEMKDMLEARKRGDQAFREKDFKTAIDCYSQKFLDVGTMVSPTVFGRRSLCYLLCDQPDAALRDAMQAQCVYPDWPTAFYMQSVALAKLNMNTDAADMLNEAAQLEEKRQRGGK